MFDENAPAQVGAAQIKQEPRMARSISRQNDVTNELLSILDTLEKRLNPVLIPSPVDAEGREETPKQISSALVEAVDRNSDRLDVAVSRIRMILSGLEI